MCVCKRLSSSTLCEATTNRRARQLCGRFQPALGFFTETMQQGPLHAHWPHLHACMHACMAISSPGHHSATLPCRRLKTNAIQYPWTLCMGSDGQTAYCTWAPHMNLEYMLLIQSMATIDVKYLIQRGASAGKQRLSNGHNRC